MRSEASPRRAGSRNPARDIERIAESFRGLAHPTRLQILSVLRAGGQMSPAQMVHEITPRMALGSIAHHTRELRALGLITPAGTEPVRGALQHFYRLSPVGEQFMQFVDQVASR
jgi:DNA-binding transcriptional ArsR family regulator